MAKIYDNKIDKTQDWGGDSSTANLPVSGRAVQEFIKNSLEKRMGVFYYDATANRHLAFSDDDNKDRYLSDPITNVGLILGSFDAPFNYDASITLLSDRYSIIYEGTRGNLIEFSFNITDKSGNTTGEGVLCTYIFTNKNKKKTVNAKYRHGEVISLNVDQYLESGVNTITISIVGEQSLAATTVGATYNIVALTLEDSFDISTIYSQSDSMIIPYYVYGYGLKSMEWYIDGVKLATVQSEDEITAIEASRTKYISLKDLTHGVHRLMFRVGLIIEDEIFYSSIHYKDVMISDGSAAKFIALSLNITASTVTNPEAIDVYEVSQYIPYAIKYAAYNSSAISSALSISHSGITSSVMAENGVEYTYQFKADAFGRIPLSLVSGETERIIYMNVAESEINIGEITNGLSLNLSALGRNNSEPNKDSWVHGDISTVFNNFTWGNTDGWIDGALRISDGRSIAINYNMFSGDAISTGKTIEIEYEAFNVVNQDAILLSCLDAAGLQITASKAFISSRSGASVETRFSQGERIRIAFVVNRSEGIVNKQLIFIYINGLLSGAMNYPIGDRLNNTLPISVKSVASEADIKLYGIRVYDTELSHEEILNNYILYRETSSEMLAEYAINDVFAEGSQTMSVDKIAAKMPVMVITGDIPTLENTSDKNEVIYVDCEYINLQQPERSFTSKGTRMKPQGTSSMGYPKKNFRFYFNYGEIIDSKGNKIPEGKYQFKDNAFPVATFCAKADYAESSSAQNTGTARIWDAAMKGIRIDDKLVGETNAQAVAASTEFPYNLRTAVDGFPICIFYKLTADSPLIFIGKYNLNNDKSTEDVFGFTQFTPEFDNSLVQCWEHLNNGHHIGIFTDVDDWSNEWKKSFEGRYPDKNQDTTHLKKFASWLSSTNYDNTAFSGDIAINAEIKPENNGTYTDSAINRALKFSIEKYDHMDIYKMAAYYVYLIRFGAVDQVVKNAMLTTEGFNGAGTSCKWYYINYDNDTIFGLRNDGRNVYNYDIDRQTLDTSYTEEVYCYAGRDSVLWNNLERDEDFMKIVAIVDKALYTSGLSYQSVINMFDDEQSKKWCTRIFNIDSQYKYIGTFTNDGINNLHMLQGRRAMHRNWWLSNRFNYYDSKWVTGSYAANFIEIKLANMPIGQQFDITAGAKLFYGYGVNNVTIESGIYKEAGEKITFVTDSVLNIGDPLRIYAAPNINGLNTYDLIEYMSTLNIASVYDATIGSKLTHLILGSDDTGAAITTRVNTALSVISGIELASELTHIDLRNFKGLTALDLSNNINIKDVKLANSGIQVLLLKNSTLSALEFSSVLTTLTLDNTAATIVSLPTTLNKLVSIKSSISVDLIMSWFNSKLSANVDCYLQMTDIDWEMSAVDFIKLSQIKKDQGTLDLEGKILLDSLDETQLAEIEAIWGSGLFQQSSKLKLSIVGGGLFVSGSANILRGEPARYSYVLLSDGAVISATWGLLQSDGSIVSSADNMSIDDSGLVTGLEAGSSKDIKIVVVVRIEGSSPLRVEKTIKVAARTLLTSIALETDMVRSTGIVEIGINKTPTSANYTLISEWTVTGTAIDNGNIVVASGGDKLKLNVNVLDESDTLSIALKVTQKDNGATKSVETAMRIIDLPEGAAFNSKSDPMAAARLYANGWTSSPDVVMIAELQAITDLKKLFKETDTIDASWFQYCTGSIDGSILSAFSECRSLTSVIIPDGVINMTNAFIDCRKLISVDIPESATMLSHAFYQCLSLISVNKIPSKATNIRACFYNCVSLSGHIYIPESVVDASLAFKYCKKLTSATVLSTKKLDMNSTFHGCNSLISVDFPALSYKIEKLDFTFYRCSKLKNCTLPGSVIDLKQTFQECVALETINLPFNTTTLYYTFLACIKLTSVTLSEKVATLHGALKGCRELSQITLPVVDASNTAVSLDNTFGAYGSYTGFDSGVDNILFVPENATGYDSGEWLDPLQHPDKCNFTISYTL